MDRAVRESLTNAGIAHQFIDKKMSLTSYGTEGVKMAKRFADGEAQTALKNGHGFFFVGDNMHITSLFHLTCRAALLTQISVQVYALPDFRDIVCGNYADDFEKLRRLPAIAVAGFYDETYKHPFTEDALVTMGWFLRNHLMKGGGLILQSTTPSAQCVWWSRGLLELIGERTITIK